MVVRNFRDLIAWQKAMDFAEAVYKATGNFPKDEIYGLRAQVRAAASSVPANIAEGQGRKSTNEFCHFLSIAHGSLCESHTQLLLSERLEYLTHPATAALIERAEEVALINGLLDSLRRKKQS
jgi:four helix bundle protein